MYFNYSLLLTKSMNATWIVECKKGCGIYTTTMQAGRFMVLKRSQLTDILDYWGKYIVANVKWTLIAKFTGPTWGPLHFAFDICEWSLADCVILDIIPTGRQLSVYTEPGEFISASSIKQCICPEGVVCMELDSNLPYIRDIQQCSLLHQILRTSIKEDGLMRIGEENVMNKEFWSWLVTHSDSWA